MLLAPLTLFLAAADQDPAAKPQTPPPAQQSVPQPAPPVQAPQWKTSLYTYWIEPPHEAGYLSAIVSADRGPLHLEAHWGYEDRDTLSIFLGKTFPIEGDLKGSITPRLGIAGGDSEGIIPAVALGLGWKQLSFTTDVEYLIGTSSDTSDFLYSWTELNWAVNERFTAGIVGERTHRFDQELSVDRGLSLGLALGKTRLTAYFFNIDESDPYVTIALSAGF